MYICSNDSDDDKGSLEEEGGRKNNAFIGKVGRFISQTHNEKRIMDLIVMPMMSKQSNSYNLRFRHTTSPTFSYASLEFNMFACPCSPLLYKQIRHFYFLSQ